MTNETIYWTTRDGSKIDVDTMSTEHLRNTLKFIVKQNQSLVKSKTDNIGDKFLEAEINAITNEYQLEYNNNLWK